MPYVQRSFNRSAYSTRSDQSIDYLFSLHRFYIFLSDGARSAFSPSFLPGRLAFDERRLSWPDAGMPRFNWATSFRTWKFGILASRGIEINIFGFQLGHVLSDMEITAFGLGDHVAMSGVSIGPRPFGHGNASREPS